MTDRREILVDLLFELAQILSPDDTRDHLRVRSFISKLPTRSLEVGIRSNLRLLKTRREIRNDRGISVPLETIRGIIFSDD